MKRTKKFFALLMALCMIFSIASVALATEWYGDGTYDSMKQFIYAGEVLEDTIQAGGEYYYQFSTAKLAGKVLKITTESTDVSVVYGRGVSSSTDGLIKLELNEYCDYFLVQNSGSESASVYFDIIVEMGTQTNPEEIKELYYSSFDTMQEEGNDAYYYTYTAPADGTISFSVSNIASETEGVVADIVVSNSSTYKQISIDGGDAVDGVLEMKVSADDEIIIKVYAYKDWDYPEATITWTGNFTYPLGSEQNPISIREITSNQTVPAGEAIYYAAYGVGGTTLSIKSENAYVIYNNETYRAENGVVTVAIEDTMFPNMPVNFQIGNSGTEEATFAVEFVYPEGSKSNPEVIEAGEYDTVFNAGDSDYYYIWTAPSDGTVTVGVSAELGWFYTATHYDSNDIGHGGDMHYSVDTTPVPSETFEVSKGDEVRISVNTYDPNDWFSTPEGTITVTVDFKSAESGDNQGTGSGDNQGTGSGDNQNTPTVPKDSTVVTAEEIAKLDPIISGAPTGSLKASTVSKEAFDKVQAFKNTTLKDRTYQMLDLKLVDENDVVKQPDGTVAITLSVTDKLKDSKTIEVFRLDDTTGELKSLGKYEVKNGKFTFNTDHFSTYVFADATSTSTSTDTTTNTSTDTTTNTGDSAPIVPMMAVAAVSVAAVVVSRKKKTVEE